jgi:YcjX-like family, DUF463
VHDATCWFAPGALVQRSAASYVMAAEHPMRLTLPPLPPLATLTEDLRLAARAVGDFGAGLVHPTVRLGVTGLSGAGKTVFITALVHTALRDERGEQP